MMKPDYCTQKDGDCPSCSLSNYGRDCVNNKIHTLGGLAKSIAGGNWVAMAKLLNTVNAGLDELDPDPAAFVPRLAIVDLVAQRPGDRVGRKLVEALRQ